MNDRSVADRLRASAEKAARLGGTRTATQAAAQVAVAKKTEQQVDVAERTGVELKIKDNPFYKALSDTQLSEEEKISSIADALDPQKQTMDSVEANFKAFQEYYSYVQSEELNEVLENIKRLIDELQGNTKIEVAAILDKLRGMLGDVDQSRKLVEVLRQARITGKTVEELSAAIDRNEDIVKRLGALDRARKTAADAADAAKAMLDYRIEARDADAKRLVRRLFGNIVKDSIFDDAVIAAQKIVDRKQGDLTVVDTQIASLQSQRNKDLESGPLTILRSLDEADDNLSERLISSGQKGIDTIQGAQKSVLQLMQRALFSEGEVDKSARRISDKQVTLTVLKSGLAEASRGTNEFKGTLEEKSSAAEKTLDTAKQGGSVLESAKAETAAIGVRAEVGRVIDYQGRLNDTVAEMNVTLSKNVERQSETDRLKSIVQGTKKSITILGRDTLNTVAGNLEGVLHNLAADQTDETQSAIVAFAHAAEEVKKGSMESMIERQKEMHTKDMGLLDDTIKRLQSSSDMIARTLEVSVDEGVERAERYRQLEGASSELEKATTTMRKVVGEMSNEAVQQERKAS